MNSDNFSRRAAMGSMVALLGGTFTTTWAALRPPVPVEPDATPEKPSRVPVAGPEMLRATEDFKATRRRLAKAEDAYGGYHGDDARQADRLERAMQRAGSAHGDARERLALLILSANGYDPDDYGMDTTTAPACGVRIGGRLLWMTPDPSFNDFANARFSSRRAVV